MKTRTILPLIVLLFAVTGCPNPNGTPSSLTIQATQYNEMFTAVEKSINDLHDQGYISVAGKRSLAPIVYGGRTALDDMAKAARTTPPNLDGWATAKDALTTALGELQKADLAAKQKKAAAAATQPSIHP